MAPILCTICKSNPKGNYIICSDCGDPFCTECIGHHRTDSTSDCWIGKTNQDNLDRLITPETTGDILTEVLSIPDTAIVQRRLDLLTEIVNEAIFIINTWIEQDLVPPGATILNARLTQAIQGVDPDN